MQSPQEGVSDGIGDAVLFSAPQTRRERRTAPSFYPSVRKQRANMVSYIARYLLGAAWWRLGTEGKMAFCVA